MSALSDGMAWFKREFGPKIVVRLAGTPYSLDMLTAIATQETYYIWSRLYKTMPVSEVLKLCVGDTLDTPNRSAFPKNRAALVVVPDGLRMFEIAREALLAMSAHVPGYGGAASNPNKFCHGFGIFQYDLQHFMTHPSHFLQKGWHDFDVCLELCVKELDAARKRAYGADKTTLNDEEMVYVAIAYNRGSVNFSKKFKQGHKDDSGKFYGEYMWDYLQLAHTVPGPSAAPPPPPKLEGAGLF